MTQSDPRHPDLVRMARQAFDPDHPKYRDNLATKVAGVVALRRLAALPTRSLDAIEAEARRLYGPDGHCWQDGVEWTLRRLRAALEGAPHGPE